MKATDRNIIMITAGGVGCRFGMDIPKQYVLLDGKPVIEYVINVCKACKQADSILVVADPSYHEMLQSRYGVDVAASGATLNETKRRGFDHIKAHSACRNLVVVDAVRPLITPDVLDLSFSLLDSGYDATTCAHKITDSLGHYGEWVCKREEYYTLTPPEGFRFDLLDRHFSSDSAYTESIHQLPDTAKVYLNFDTPYFDKLTYPEDLIRLEALIKWKQGKHKS